MTYVRTEKHNGKYKWIHLLKCLYCTTPYERIAANKSPKSNGWCSKECRKAWHKSQSRLNLVCKNCEREFEVYNYQKHYTFCSHKCYHKHIKDNPEQYNLYQKAAKARSNSLVAPWGQKKMSIVPNNPSSSIRSLNLIAFWIVASLSNNTSGAITSSGISS